jgi:PKD repeat protein
MMKTTLHLFSRHWKNCYIPRWLVLALLLGLLFSHAQADITNSPGQAIIIAGGGDHAQNTLFPYSNELTQRMYRLLKERDFSDTDILYMNPQPPDIDKDGYLEIENQDYDLSNPAQELVDAFSQAAANLRAGQQFVFYLHGHALPDNFIITRDYELSSSQLHVLLATLPVGVQQIIILDASYSGSFLDDLAGVENRIILTSADADNPAWNVNYPSFSDKLINELRRGKNLWKTFQSAEDMIIGEPKIFGNQRPWLDDDGDGLYTPRDGRVAENIYLGAITVFEQPPIADFTISPQQGEVPLPITLDASNSNDPDGSIVKYEWSVNGQTLTDKITSLTLTATGEYPITLTVTDEQGLTATTQQEVHVGPPAGSLGQAIIVAAGDTQRQNRALNRYTQDFTERMYRLLNNRGFQDDDIHLINMWPQDIDLDGHPDTQRQDYNLFDPEKNFTEAFAQAASRIVSGQQFIFYIHGHARENHFIITSDYELSATRLRDLLATLPAGVQQIIILDSCYSGSFLDELSGVPNRIVISSADATSRAWNTINASFSQKFIVNLRRQDLSVLDAFHAAEDMIKIEKKLFRDQTPWLDDDGDGVYSSQDGRLAAKINLGCLVAEGCASAAPPPAIVHLHEQLNFESSQLTLWVETSPGEDAIHQVRAVFVNPEFVSKDYKGEATDFEREEVNLIYNPAQTRYEVPYDGFWNAGLWRIMYQAQNKEGVWSDIVTGEVNSNINCNPCVKMSKNQSRYNAANKDELRLDMLINGQGALVDLYVALIFPDGNWITIAFPFTISMPNSIQVYQQNVEINEQRRLSIMDFPLPTDVAKGNYKICGILTGAGNDPHLPENWLHIHCADFEVY